MTTANWASWKLL